MSNDDAAALRRAIEGLSSVAAALESVQNNLARLVSESRLFELQFTRDGKGELAAIATRTNPPEIAAADSLIWLEVAPRCKHLPKHVESLQRSCSEAQQALDGLPKCLTDKLDSLSDSPWVARVRRQCVDSVLAWPGQIYGPFPTHVAGLLNTAGESDPIPTWANYLELLRGYVADLFAVRDAVKTKDADAGNQPASGTENATGDDPLLTHVELAARYNLEREAARKKLDRWRSKNSNGWIEATDTRPNEPKYLYRLSAVESLFGSASA